MYGEFYVDGRVIVLYLFEFEQGILEIRVRQLVVFVVRDVGGFYGSRGAGWLVLGVRRLGHDALGPMCARREGIAGPNFRDDCYGGGGGRGSQDRAGAETRDSSGAAG